jgi:hypothetical protein
MNARSLGLVAAGALAALALVVMLAPTARSQVEAAPSFVPIGVSSSGSTSTVWFHEPLSRQALACQTVQQGSTLSSIQCVAVKLPS